MRLGRLRWPEWLIAIGGAVLLAAMLGLPWFTAPHRSVDGWNGLTHLRWVLLVAVALALATALLQATLCAPAIPVTLTLFAAMFGGLGAVVLIYRVLADPPGGNRKIGGFVALAASIGIAYGGLQSLRADSVAEPDGPAEIPVIGSVPTTGGAAGS